LIATLAKRRVFDIVKSQKIWGAATSALRAGDRYYREIAVSRETL
jgi:hypothetical protein